MYHRVASYLLPHQWWTARLHRANKRGLLLPPILFATRYSGDTDTTIANAPTAIFRRRWRPYRLCRRRRRRLRSLSSEGEVVRQYLGDARMRGVCRMPTRTHEGSGRSRAAFRRGRKRGNHWAKGKGAGGCDPDARHAAVETFPAPSRTRQAVCCAAGQAPSENKQEKRGPPPSDPPGVRLVRAPRAYSTRAEHDRCLPAWSSESFTAVDVLPRPSRVSCV